MAAAMALLRAALLGCSIVLTPAIALGAPPPEPADEEADAEEKADEDVAEGEAAADEKKTEEEPPEEESSLPGEEKADTHFLPNWISVGVGFLGQAGGNFLDKPGDQGVPGVNCGVAQACDPEYPGFAGFTGGFGAMIDVRFFGYVGIEMDILYVPTAKGSADIDVTLNNEQGKYSLAIGGSAVHLPLLLKGSVPGSVVQPQLVLGPELVFPSSDVEFEKTLNSGSPVPTKNYGAKAPESYTYFTFGLGLEFMLPIPSVDIRIPLTLRGSVNPGVSGERAERATPEVVGGDFRGETYITEWKFKAVANFGASWHF
jgi:hypothetical protein